VSSIPRVPAKAELVLAYPTPTEPVRHVRSTLLIASIDNVRADHRFDEYAALVPRQYHQALFESVAGVWLPLDAALAHYRACDALQLAESTAVGYGKKTVERVGQSMVGTVLRMAKQAGTTPWSFYPLVQRFWMRGYDGGGIAIYRMGPKDARLDLVQSALCESPFYRRALRGWLTGLTLLFCRTLYLQEMGQHDGSHSVAYRAQWV
jgi:hypothetical protein